MVWYRTGVVRCGHSRPLAAMCGKVATETGRNTGSVVVTRQSRQIARSTVFRLQVPYIRDRMYGGVPGLRPCDCAPRAALAAGASEPGGAGMAAARPRAMG